MPEIVFISGCSSGIGLATAMLLAHDPQKRFLVYATVLKPPAEEVEFRKRTEGALNVTLFPIQMDVTKEEMIVDAVAMVMKKHSRIDILINIAGLNLFDITEYISSRAMRRVFDVNFFGTVRVTQEVLPIMKQQRSGRIINMGSVHGLVAFPYMGLYGATKQAIVAFSQEIAVIGRFFNIRVSVIEPGGVNTAIMENMIAQQLGGRQSIRSHPNVGDTDRTLSTCFDHGEDFHSDLLSPSQIQEPDDIAKLILRVATEEKPHFRYQTSQACRNLAERFFKDVTGDSFIEFQVRELESFRRKVQESAGK
ncbi:retinol dehydrogenase 8-like [Diadema setosum]|uniref:retinol dehydrogenase 8-like n=1 Tax=Diadema setosum TaxID=31175 RepID=UPI003B3B1915